MKFTKMSLVAALLIGSSAFAIDNVKVSGDAKLYYSTSDSVANAGAGNASNSLFNKGNSTGEAALRIGLTADLTQNISAGVSGTVISTLGLYNNLVSATWTGGTEDTYVMDEAWLAATVGKTTGKIGRMKLDTPLVFSETWSIIPNTFEAAVVINQDIPDTTLVGAYVGQHDSAQVIGGGMNQASSPFTSFYNGAYTIGVINNSVKPLTVQGWYYGAQTNIDFGTLIQDPTIIAPNPTITVSHIDAFWLQADLDAADLGVKGLKAGVQYTKNTYDLKTAIAGVPGSTNNDAYALMLGYNVENMATVKVAYSQVGKDNDSGMGAGFNLATVADGNGILRGSLDNRSGAQSKLYTEAWWNYGYVTQNDAKTWSLSATGKVVGVDLLAQYTNVNQSKSAGDNDMKEFTVTAGKDFGPLNATLAYIYTKADDLNTQDKNGVNFNTDGKGKAFNTVQAYLTYNF